MVKPMTISSGDPAGKDPIVKEKEDLKAKEESVVVVTSGPPTKVKPSKKRCKVFTLFLLLAVILLLILAFTFVRFGCAAESQHDEGDSGDTVEHGDRGGLLDQWRHRGDGDGDNDRGHHRLGHRGDLGSR